MKPFTLLLLLMTLIPALDLSAQAVQDEIPPIIDRALFFDDPEITSSQLSPDGKFIAFIKPFEDVRNIWVKKADEPFENARPLTADKKRPIPGYFWSRDSKNILFVQDDGGDENFHVYAVNPEEKVKRSKKVPKARALTSGQKVRAMIYSVPKNQPEIIYVGLNDRDPAWHDLYKVNISTGKKELIRKNEDRITNWTFDLKGKLRLATRSNDDGSNDLLEVTDDGFDKIYSWGIFETVYPLRFHRDGKGFYMVTNKTGKRDLTELVLFNLSTKAYEFVDSDPLKKVDFGGAFFSRITDYIVGTSYTDDRTRRYWTHEGYKASFDFLNEKFKGKEVSVISRTNNDKQWLISVWNDKDPGATYLYNRKNNEVFFQFRPRPNLPVEHLADMNAISYKSSDGMEIPAYLVLPKGVKPGRLPLIVMPHGGPWARTNWGYNSYAQFLANRGYAVLLPNFRGSTGYGKKFLNAGNMEWGKKMQDDLTFGVHHLVNESMVNPRKVGIMGGSYGGYATLAGLTFTPEVYACGVSIVGPSNLLTLLESIPPYWESIRNMFYERMGNPENEEGKILLERSSPLFSANKIKSPLMVVQGANDPRVKKAESDQIVVAMRELNLPVEYIVAPDEGHGFRRPVNNMAFLAAAEKFLSTHLGGRYQEDMTEEISKRLSEITVDPMDVTLPEELAANIIAAPVPVPEKDLTPGISNYKVKMEMNGQKIEMDQTRTISDSTDYWCIQDNLVSVMGTMKDITMVEKGSLLPFTRMVNQGPVVMNIEYFHDKVKGEMVMSSKVSPIESSLKGSLFADGAGASHIIAALPLKKGYSTVYRNFDLQSQKVKVMRLSVEAEEEITVPAGTFKALKVVSKPANGDPGVTTMWISNDNDRLVLKTMADVPEMGGAVISTELLK